MLIDKHTSDHQLQPMLRKQEALAARAASRAHDGGKAWSARAGEGPLPSKDGGSTCDWGRHSRRFPAGKERDEGRGPVAAGVGGPRWKLSWTILKTVVTD